MFHLVRYILEYGIICITCRADTQYLAIFDVLPAIYYSAK